MISLQRFAGEKPLRLPILTLPVIIGATFILVCRWNPLLVIILWQTFSAIYIDFTKYLILAA